MSNWFGELDRFEAELRSLAVTLRREADSMERELRLPSEDLIVALESTIKHFRAIAEQVTRSGDVYSADATALNTVNQLRDVIRADHVRRQKLVDGFRSAKSVLARVIRLRHRELNSFHPLDECQEAARSLQSRIDWVVEQTKTEETLEQIRVDVYPFEALVQLVEEIELPDDLWEASRTQVEDRFGRDLSRAAIRAKLIFVPEEASRLDAAASTLESNIPKPPPLPDDADAVVSPRDEAQATAAVKPLRKSMRASPMVLGSSVDVDLEKMPSTVEPHVDAKQKTTTRPPPPSLVHQPIPVDQILDRVLGSASRQPETSAATAATTVAEIETPIEEDPAPANDTISENVLVAPAPLRVEGETSVHAEPTSTEPAVAQMAASVDVPMDSIHAGATIQDPPKTTLQDVVEKPFAGASQDDGPKTELGLSKVEVENDDASLQTISTSLTSLTDALPEDPIELAKLIRNIGIDYADHAVRRLVWELIRQNRIGIAYHIVRCLETRARAPADMLPSSILRAMTVAPLIDSSYGESVEELSVCIHAINDEAYSTTDRPHAIRLARDLVLFGISLRPALFAPSTGAAVLLEQLDLQGHLTGLNPLREAILAFSRVNLQLTPTILMGVREFVAWESEIQNQREKCRSWREHSKHAQLNYAPATYVWRGWFEPGGLLTSLFDIVVGDRRERSGDLTRSVELWSSQPYVHQMIDKTDRERRPDAKMKPIEARAKGRLQELTKEAVTLLKEWLDILARDPSRGADSEYIRATACREKVQNELEGAIDTVEMLMRKRQSRSLLVACERATTALDDLFRMFNADASDTEPHGVPQEALCDELLTIPSISLERDWSISNAHYAKSEVLEALLAHIARGPVDWRTAFEEQTGLGSHEATELILERLTNHPVDGIDVRELRIARAQDIEERRKKLDEMIRATKEVLERAISEDLFPESEVMDFRSVVEGINLREVVRFGPLEARLVAVHQRIRARRDERVGEVRKQLEHHAAPEDLKTIQQALDNGNLLAANEYIAMLGRGEVIRLQQSARDSLSEFFPTTLQAIHNAIDGSTKRDLIRAIGFQNSAAPFDMSGVSEEQAEEAKRMLYAWNEALNFEGGDAGGQLTKSLDTVLQSLGFRNIQLVPNDARGADKLLRLYNLQTKPLKEPQTCVIPQYGSMAAGHYRLLCVWKRRSEEELRDLVAASQQHDRPLILFYFVRMSELRRRSIAHLSRQRRLTFILIDENLLFFLAMEKGQRLSALFSCTFPFTLVDPYTTTAGLVPLEMFFGRAQARQDIFDTTGTCLVYGGRQLGKTALLRDTERRYHAPEKGIYVKWIDLKAEGIGMNRPIRDLWTTIARTLHEEKILTRTDYGRDTLGDRIADWLEKDRSRRIVLLLDEADTFLKSDAETAEGLQQDVFANVAHLKGIMDKTLRRFKVVFAGLHNVQRTARDVNSPLHHLGTPICIGPLLENGESQEARRLVTMPFLQLGYRFENADELPTRILAHANWYPSLIQLFCKHLLEHLTDSNKTSFNSQSCPPYIITLQHIEEAYQKQGLRKAIVDRFQWTLDLDPRYRVIALVIAYESAQRREGLASGFPLSWIREQALSWWESGFQGTLTLEGFRTILDEMIGLGLLRKVGPANYALRSPNVINLLGTADEIEQALFDAIAHEAPPIYEASTFRRTDEVHNWRRSPLTALQESELFAPSNEVVLLFGSKPAGLDDLLVFLRAAAKTQAIDVEDDWRDVKSATLFRDMLLDRMDRREEGVSLFVVPNSCPWAPDWADEAISKVGIRKSKKRFVKVIFVADPKKTQLWLNRAPITSADERTQGVKEMTLNPWHSTAVRRWLMDIGLGPPGGSKAGIERFGAATGNWGLFLHEIAMRCEKNQWERQLAVFTEELLKSREWFDNFEITDAAMPVLKILAEMEGALNLDEICELLPNLTRRDVECSISWADHLSFVSLAGIQQWRIDPLLGRLLKPNPT